MKEKPKWTRIVFIIGIVIFLIGTLDPLEGSLLIVPGSLMMAFAAIMSKDRHRKIFTASATMIIVGVIMLFYISSLGGFGGTSKLSNWWGLVILPYPAGWLLTVVLLLTRAFSKKKKQG